MERQFIYAAEVLAARTDPVLNSVLLTTVVKVPG